MPKISDILCCSEHWLREEEIVSIKLQGFTPINYYCRKKFKCGGVIIFVRTGLTATPFIIKTELNIEKHFECTAMEIESVVYGHVIVVCLYRAPCGNFRVFVENLTKVLHLLKTKKNIIVCGDFNVNFLSVDTDASTLIDLFMSFGLSMMIQGPTRVMGHHVSCIDNIFSNMENVCAQSVDAGLSDHFVQMLSCAKQVKSNERLFIEKRLFNEANIDIFKLAMSAVNWDTVYSKSTVDDMFNEFMSIFNKHFNETFPVQRIHNKKTNRNANTWFTKELRELSKEVQRLYINFKQSASSYDKIKYFNIKKEYSKALRDGKRNMNINRIHSSDNKSKAAWNVIKMNMNGGQTSKSKEDDALTLLHDGKSITSFNELSNIFNNYYKNAAQIALNLNKSGDEDYLEPYITYDHSISSSSHGSNNFYLSPVNKKEFFEIVQKVTKKRSFGFDEVPCHIIKFVAVFLAEPLIFIINESFHEGIFPERLKKTVICPIYKKGNRNSVENYRPIALLSVFSKIVEKAFCNKLVHFLEKFSLMSDSQHGFRRGRSTITAITSFILRVFNSLDSRESSLGIFYDFTKAFDMVHHGMLLHKLTKFGIVGLPNNWLRSYLSNRRQVVKLMGVAGTVFSKEVVVNIGVPQGSVIAPLLFILFTDDLSRCVQSGDFTLFADDTTHFLNSESDISTIDSFIRNNTATTHLVEWVEQNGLCLNSSKSVILQFNGNANNNNASSPLIYLNGQSLKVQNSTRFLGITLDDKLNWNEHISALAKQVSSGCYLVRRIMEICNFHTAKLVYYSYIHSRISYGIILWGHSSKTKRLFILQKRAIRYLANVSYDPCTAGVFYKDSCRPLFIKFKILTLPCIYILNVIMFVLENEHCIPFLSETHKYNTRNHNDFNVIRTINASKCPIQVGTSFFNKLNKSLKSKVDYERLHLFKASLKEFLISNCFYSTKEFLEYMH